MTSARRTTTTAGLLTAVALAVVALLALALGSTTRPAAAATTTTADAKFGVHAAFAGRTTDLRVGEPLVLTYRGAKIGRACWQPAPLVIEQCSTKIAAASKAGTQKIELKFDDGKTVNVSFPVGAATKTALPTDGSALPGEHSVTYRALCGVKAYANFSGGKLKDPNPDGDLAKGDKLAAFYRAGSKALQGFAYANGKSGFYSAGCLQQVK